MRCSTQVLYGMCSASQLAIGIQILMTPPSFEFNQASLILNVPQLFGIRTEHLLRQSRRICPLQTLVNKQLYVKPMKPRMRPTRGKYNPLWGSC
jgi:hypothetical protein